MPPTVLTEGLELIRRNWGWYLALGTLLVVLGMVALSCTLTTTIAVMLLAGWLLICSGVAEAVMAFRMQSWGGVLLHFLGGILEFVVGLLVLKSPGEAALVLTMLIAVYLIVGGLFRLGFALTHRFPGAGLIALGGAVSAALGLIVALEWPVSGLQFIGVCVGVDLIMQGVSWVSFALAARRLPSAAA